MWIVYNNIDGVYRLFDNRKDAEKEYQEVKEQMKDYVDIDGMFSRKERLVLAKVQKQTYSYDTKEPVMEEDEEGNEIETKDTYWGWKEENYF